MKKLLVLLMLFGFVGVVSATELSNGAYFKLGQIEFTYPLANTSAIALYDFQTAEGLLGAETKLVSWQRLNLNFGAVTSFKENGMPFLSLDFDWAGIVGNLSDTKLAKFGIWAGHDFKLNENHTGIKASVPLWGN
ncbi:MAG: hypothetical protein M0Q46_06150 [Endomicrobiales bacterium]|nr:hypothetical protein [Endomicrobiales bacterium]